LSGADAQYPQPSTVSTPTFCARGVRAFFIFSFRSISDTTPSSTLANNSSAWLGRESFRGRPDIVRGEPLNPQVGEAQLGRDIFRGGDEGGGLGWPSSILKNSQLKWG